MMKTNRTALGIWAATASVALTLTTGTALLAAPATATPAASASATREQATSYIVQAGSLAAAKAAVQAAGGRITHELGIINGVAATLSPAQAQTLRAVKGLELQQDAAAQTQGGTVPNQYARQMLNVDALAAQGITGNGVTVAILDTGIWYSRNEVKNDLNGTNKIRVMYDAIANKVQNTPDRSGHGSHIASIIGSPQLTINDQPLGIAPMARLVAVKAFNDQGQGTYADVIRGLDWILANRAAHNIRVLNLSFGATVQSNYWNDPVNKAVMKLWQAGVVVVASAGNWGPYAQSITVPGNTPYVITVGAMTDSYTPSNLADDRLASFSSTGPTYEGFVKPEVIAPGGHMPGKNDNGTMAIPKAYPAFATTNDMTFVMSGTSQSAAVVSGVVALMLQAQPSLTPNGVKCKLMSSARAAIDGTGKASYTVFQQGAGQVNAYDAVYTTDTTCANVGLNIAADLAGTQRFGGPARQDPVTGDYYLVDEAGQRLSGSGYVWKNGYAWNQGYIWKKDYAWNQGYVWKKANAWNNGYVWKKATGWNQTFVPAKSSYSGINHWVDQE